MQIFVSQLSVCLVCLINFGAWQRTNVDRDSRTPKDLSVFFRYDELEDIQIFHIKEQLHVYLKIFYKQ